MNSNEVESKSDDYESKGKKICHPSSHKRNVIRISKISGTAYTNWIGKNILTKFTSDNHDYLFLIKKKKY